MKHRWFVAAGVAVVLTVGTVLFSGPRSLAEPPANALGMRFVPFKKGTFWMGGGGGNPGEKQVEIKQDFQLGVTEVTQGQWQAVMGDNPSHFSRKGKGKEAVKDVSDEDLLRFPVENVSWDMAQAFLKKLNAREKESGWVYRLPTEAEWEYACRGGASSKEDCSFHFYLDRPLNALSSTQANFDGNLPFGGADKGPYRQRPTRVASFAPNKAGLFDMHGNVWEWCEDGYKTEAAPYRVYRGGGWYGNAECCRAGPRYGGESDDRNYDLGLRLARVPSGK